jgi:hypothetical protein
MRCLETYSILSGKFQVYIVGKFYWVAVAAVHDALGAFTV